MAGDIAAAAIRTPPEGFAVIGIVGPDSAPHRASLREWTRAVAPAVLVRFAVSLRDRATARWWRSSAAAAEPDVDFLDCLSQQTGQAVVIFSLLDAWLRHAVARYPHAAFIGRADSDAVPSPQWLFSVLSAQAAHPERAHSRRVYVGSFQWYHWDQVTFRPWGWGGSPRTARGAAKAERREYCNETVASPRCSGPFPFAIGPLFMLSAALARCPLSLERARERGLFLRPADAGDLDVRLFDDVFLGHALCMGGAANVSALVFPPGVFTDVPCVGKISGCRNGMDRYNWSALGAPLLLHRVRQPEYVPMALERLRRAPMIMPQAPVTCTPMAEINTWRSKIGCGAEWQWCPMPAARLAIRRVPPRTPRVGKGKAKGGGANKQGGRGG